MQDITIEDVRDFKFTTSVDGVPTVLTGTPVVSAYEDNSITQITAGVVLTPDFDGVVGLNHVRVTATAANGFEAGKSYSLVITTGTVGGSSVVGHVVEAFTIARSPALARLPAALVGGRMDSSVGAMAANVLTAAAINAAALNGKGDWNIGKTGYALSAAGVQAIWDALTSALTAAGSIGKLLVDNINAAVSSRSSHSAADVWTSVTRSLTDKVGFSLGTGGVISGAIAAAELNAIADAILDRNMTTGTDSGTDSGAVRTVRQALRRLRNREAIAAGVGTIYKEDDITASWTYAATTTAGDPLSQVNPT